MEELLVSVEAAARSLGVGRDAVYELLASGQLPRIKVGRRTLVPVAAVREWVERQASATRLAAAALESKESPVIPVLIGESHNRRRPATSLRQVGERVLAELGERNGGTPATMPDEVARTR